MRRDTKPNTYCWVIYVGEALVDKGVRPAVVYLSPSLHSALHYKTPFAWQSVLEYAEELVNGDYEDA